MPHTVYRIPFNSLPKATSYNCFDRTVTVPCLEFTVIDVQQILDRLANLVKYGMTHLGIKIECVLVTATEYVIIKQYLQLDPLSSIFISRGNDIVFYYHHPIKVLPSLGSAIIQPEDALAVARHEFKNP